MTGGRVST